MKNLEEFINVNQDFHPIIRAGLAHHQFETIHPFFDGNGRIGRMLIPLMLCRAGIISDPILYLSLYIKHHREQYYALLQDTRNSGDWETWIDWFLTGIITTAAQAAEAVSRITDLYGAHREIISQQGSAAPNALRVHEFMVARPVTSARILAEQLNITVPTVQKAIGVLQALDIVREMTGKKRNRIYAYKKLLDILDEGTEPLPAAG